MSIVGSNTLCFSLHIQVNYVKYFEELSGYDSSPYLCPFLSLVFSYSLSLSLFSDHLMLVLHLVYL